MAAFNWLAAPTATATNIDITAGNSGVLTPSLSTATVLNFDALPLGPLTSYQFSGGSLTGFGSIESSASLGPAALPPGQNSQVLEVVPASGVGLIRFLFDTPENYFGLNWDAIKPYNLIAFFKNSEFIAAFSGTDVAQATGLLTDAGPPWADRYINFYTHDAYYDGVLLITLAPGFEVSSVAFGDPPPTEVPEPSPLPLLASAFVATAFAGWRSGWRRHAG